MNQLPAVPIGARHEATAAAHRVGLEGDDLVRPKQPVGEVFEVGATSAVDELLLVYGALGQRVGESSP
jgi:hypothetical protein